MVGFLLTIGYVLLFLLFFQLKSLRDYLLEHKAGYIHRWEDSIWINRLPLWFQGYLIDNPRMFIDNNPPWWFRIIVWSSKKNSFRTTAIDGWHQTDGAIFVSTFEYIVIILNIYVWHLSFWWLLPIMVGGPVIFYQYFNFVFHVQHREKNKEWHRVRWPFTLLKRFYRED